MNGFEATSGEKDVADDGNEDILAIREMNEDEDMDLHDDVSDEEVKRTFWIQDEAGESRPTIEIAANSIQSLISSHIKTM